MNLRYFPVILFFLTFAFLGASLWLNGTRNVPGASGLNGEALPELTLNHIMGERFEGHDAAFKGHVTVLNIFASWCVPCIAELPQLTALYGEKDVKVIGIAWHDSAATIKNWVAQHGAQFHSIYQDADNQTGVKLGIRGVPETFIIDKKGVIRYRHQGPLDRFNREKHITPLIHTLVGEVNG